MEPESAAIGSSLLVLTGLLGALAGRGFDRFRRHGMRSELMWAIGLSFGAAAMAIESTVYLGFVSRALLQAYVFLSAAIVGFLSLGATRVLRSLRVERAYTGFILGATGLVALASGLTPLSDDMVSNGVIVGNPPPSLIALSSVVTFPATVLLVLAAVQALRRSRNGQTLLLIAGALILGAGGTLYIASWPVALYYAEFVGIVLLFVGLVSLPAPSSVSVAIARHPPSSA